MEKPKLTQEEIDKMKAIKSKAVKEQTIIKK